MHFIFLSFTAQAQVADFNATVEAARGQTVYFNAWGGDDKINDYIEWAGDELKSRHGITVVHVKLADTAAAVSRILAEKTAGRDSGGSVDLLWVNGENFAAMKRNGLLQAEEGLALVEELRGLGEEAPRVGPRLCPPRSESPAPRAQASRRVPWAFIPPPGQGTACTGRVF